MKTTKRELKRKLAAAEKSAAFFEGKLMDSIILGSKIAEAYGKEIGIEGSQVIMVIAGSGSDAE